MDHVTKNVIDWNRRAANRALTRARRADTEDARLAAQADLTRHQGNIEFLEGQAR